MPRWSGVTLSLLAVLTFVGMPLTASVPGRDAIQTVVQIGCLAVAWYFVLHRTEVTHHGWRMLALAVSVLACSDMVNALERDVWDLHWTVKPSAVLALVGYVLLGTAVFRLDRKRSRGRKLPGAIESAIFASGAFPLVLVFLVLPVLHHASMTTSEKTVTISFAIADLVIITIIARLLLTDGGHSKSFAFLSSALFVSLAGDIWSWVVTSEGPAPTVASVKILWLAGFLLFAAGVAHPSMESFTTSGSWSSDAPRARRVWLMGVGQALPPIGLGLAWLFDVSSSLLVLAVGGLVVSFLVSARMNGLLDRIGAQSSKLEDLASRDELTGLHNRRSWNAWLADAAKASVVDGRPYAVALLDIDHFKDYNDNFGHPAGDRMLAAAAESWRRALPAGMLIARYGGEEFAVLLPDTDLDDAVSVIDEVRAATPGGQTFSAGVALGHLHRNPEQAMADADAALYEAKRRGRNRVVPYRESEGRFSPSLVPHDLRAVVQPIVRSSDLQVVAYEGLSRLDEVIDVEQVFLQAHEDSYGDLMESRALLNVLGLPGRPAGVELFVNVSERAMISPQFWDGVPSHLEGVVVELHESRHGLDDAAVGSLLGRFRDRGARTCLDDLVANELDLERIGSLRPDYIKIDRSLVSGCDASPTKRAGILSLVGVSRNHGVQVIAEGIETPGELAALRLIGVPLLQGHLLGRPAQLWVDPLRAPVLGTVLGDGLPFTS
jgi:diguanylate cyclase (GGDEF)-like protein